MKIDTKEIKPYYPIILYIASSLIIIYFLNLSDKSSNVILAITTLLSGVLIVYTYIKQKVDRKKDVASLILQEVRYAETRIRNYLKSASYGLYDKLLPTNSWNNNIHLFVNELEETELDLISSFYSKCYYIDILIERIGDIKTSCCLVKEGKYNPPGDGEIFIPTKENLINKEIKIKETEPTERIQQILLKISSDVELIYTTTIMEKFKNIANK